MRSADGASPPSTAASAPTPDSHRHPKLARSSERFNGWELQPHRRIPPGLRRMRRPVQPHLAGLEPPAAEHLEERPDALRIELGARVPAQLAHRLPLVERFRYGRRSVIARNASQTETMRAPTGMSWPPIPSG